MKRFLLAFGVIAFLALCSAAGADLGCINGNPLNIRPEKGGVVIECEPAFAQVFPTGKVRIAQFQSPEQTLPGNVIQPPPGAVGVPAIIAPSQKTSIIDLSPLVGQVAAPIVNAIVDVLIVVVGGWLAWLYHRITGRNLDAKALETYEIAAQNRAHQLVALGAVKVGADAKLQINNATLASVANDLMAKNGDSMKRLGQDAGDAAARIVQKLPQVSAVATAQAAALAPPQPPAEPARGPSPGGGGKV